MQYLGENSRSTNYMFINSSFVFEKNKQTNKQKLLFFELLVKPFILDVHYIFRIEKGNKDYWLTYHLNHCVLSL